MAPIITFKDHAKTLTPRIEEFRLPYFCITIDSIIFFGLTIKHLTN